MLEEDFFMVNFRRFSWPHLRTRLQWVSLRATHLPCNFVFGFAMARCRCMADVTSVSMEDQEKEDLFFHLMGIIWCKSV